MDIATPVEVIEVLEDDEEGGDERPTQRFEVTLLRNGENIIPIENEKGKTNWLLRPLLEGQEVEKMKDTRGRKKSK